MSNAVTKKLRKNEKKKEEKYRQKKPYRRRTSVRLDAAMQKNFDFNISKRYLTQNRLNFSEQLYPNLYKMVSPCAVQYQPEEKHKPSKWDPSHLVSKASAPAAEN